MIVLQRMPKLLTGKNAGSLRQAGIISFSCEIWRLFAKRKQEALEKVQFFKFSNIIEHK